MNLNSSDDKTDEWCYICTVCNDRIGHREVGPHAFIAHPVLRVLICQSCHSHFIYDHKTKLDRIQDLCIWCFKQGELKCCSLCLNQYCLQCLKQNLEPADYNKVSCDEFWVCVNCDSKPIRKLQTFCKKSLLRMEQTAQESPNKPQSIFRRHTVNNQSTLVRRKSWHCPLTPSTSDDLENDVSDENLQNMKDKCNKKLNELIKLFAEVNEEVLKSKSEIAETFTPNDFYKKTSFLKNLFHTLKITLNLWENEVGDWKFPVVDSFETKDLLCGKRKFNLSIKRLSDSETNDEFSNTIDTIVEESAVGEDLRQSNQAADINQDEEPNIMEVSDDELNLLNHSSDSQSSGHSISSQTTVVFEIPPSVIEQRGPSIFNSGDKTEDTKVTDVSTTSSDSETSFVFDLHGYIPNDCLTTDDLFSEDVKKESDLLLNLDSSYESKLNCDIDDLSVKSLDIKDDLSISVSFNITSHSDCDFTLENEDREGSIFEGKVKDEFAKQSEYLELFHLIPKASLAEDKEKEDDKEQKKQEEEELEAQWESVLQHVKDDSFILSDSCSLSGSSDNNEFNDEYNLPRGIHGSISYEMPKLPETTESEHTWSCEGATANVTERDYLQHYKIKPCQVVLHKINLDETVKCIKDNEESIITDDKEIERLINLDTIERKRKQSVSDPKEPITKKPKTSTTNVLCNSDVESDSDSIISAFDEENLSEPPPEPANENLDEFQSWDAVMNAVMEDDIGSLHEYESGETSIKKLKRSSSQGSNKENVIEELLSLMGESPEEHEQLIKDESISLQEIEELQKDSLKSSETNEQSKKDSWKSDPLLRCNLNEKTVPRVKNELSKPEKATVKTKNLETNGEKDDCDSVSIISDNSNRDGDFEDNCDRIIINSESDSDIEFVSMARNTNKNDNTSLNDIELKSTASDRKGRRNIRSILEDEILSDSTKEANVAEKERNLRLSQRQKNMDLILSQASTEPEQPGLILDIDEKTALPIVVVDPKLTHRLKSHQKMGVKFMWENCYEGIKEISSGNLGSGCILAHCMGLGKTLQVIALIHTLFSHPATKTKCVLIVSPLTVVNHWVREFADAFEYVSNNNFVPVYHISEQRKQLNIINNWFEGGGALILGYERLKILNETSNDKIQAALCDPGPDLIVFDEGHALKNERSARYAILKKLKTKRRIVLTGTPLQNNLMEYYYMIQCVKPNLLGSKAEYRNRFTNPITNGQYDDSTEQDIIQMKKRSHVLHKLLKNTIQRFEASVLLQYVPQKRDFAIFINLHDIQKKLYDFQIEMNTDNCDSVPLTELIKNYHRYQNIWTHIHLFRLKQVQLNALPKEQFSNMNQKGNLWWEEFGPKDSDTNVDYGPKFKVMLSIIDEAQKLGDKVLVFTNSLLELSAIQHFLEKSATPSCQWIRNKDYFRMDGGTSIDKRDVMCKKFNEKTNTRGRVFLISIKVGGLGLNLVGANRVILMDVNWNPAVDNQGVYRICRFGQEKKCYVYRLVSLGTMEEVVYERQVTKLAISARVVDKLQICRHYKSADLQQIYRSKFIYDQPRPILLPPDDNVLANVYQTCPEIFKYHEHQSLLENLPHENLNESEMKLAWDEFNDENEKRQQAREQHIRTAANQAASWINPNRATENVLNVQSTSNQNVSNVGPFVTASSLKMATPITAPPVHSISDEQRAREHQVQTATNQDAVLNSTIRTTGTVDVPNILRTSNQTVFTNATSLVNGGANKMVTTIAAPPLHSISEEQQLKEQQAKVAPIQAAGLNDSKRTTENISNMPRTSTQAVPNPAPLINSGANKITAPPLRPYLPVDKRTTENVLNISNMPRTSTQTVPNPASLTNSGANKITAPPLRPYLPVDRRTTEKVPNISNMPRTSTQTVPNPASLINSGANKKVSSIMAPPLRTYLPVNRRTTENVPNISNMPRTSTQTVSNPASLINSGANKMVSSITSPQLRPFLPVDRRSTTKNVLNLSNMPRTSKQTVSNPAAVNKMASSIVAPRTYRAVHMKDKRGLITLKSQATNANRVVDANEMKSYIDRLVNGELVDGQSNAPTNNTPQMLNKEFIIRQTNTSRGVSVIKPTKSIHVGQGGLPSAQFSTNQQNSANSNSSRPPQIIPSTSTKVLIRKLLKNPAATNTSTISKPPEERLLPTANDGVTQPPETFINLDNYEDDRRAKHQDLLTTLNSNANITLSAIMSASKEKSPDKGDVIEID